MRNLASALWWHSFECYGCGLICDVRLAREGREEAPSFQCPDGCGRLMSHRAWWPAVAGGFGSRADSDLERIRASTGNPIEPSRTPPDEPSEYAIDQDTSAIYCKLRSGRIVRRYASGPAWGREWATASEALMCPALTWHPVTSADLTFLAGIT